MAENGAECEFSFDLDMTRLQQFSEHILYNVACLIVTISVVELSAAPVTMTDGDAVQDQKLVELANYKSIVSISKPDYGVDLHMSIFKPF